MNEILRGFDQPGMEQTVGVEYATLMKEDAAFYAHRNSAPETISDDLALAIRPQVIAEAIRRLGVDEFQTRTGHSLNEGYQLLDKVKKHRD